MTNDTRPVFSVASQLIEHAAKLYGVEPWKVVRKGRSRQLFMPRFAVIWALRQLRDPADGSATPYSYSRLARLLGFDDHTSVLHGYRRAEGLRTTDRAFRDLTNELVVHAMASGPQIPRKIAA